MIIAINDYFWVNIPITAKAIRRSSDRYAYKSFRQKEIMNVDKRSWPRKVVQ